MKQLAGWMAAAALLIVPGSAAAADREQQLIMAELRMLQQQQQQLQQQLGALAETLKLVTSKLDEQAASGRKALADQRLLIEGMGDTVRILRERSDDTNVRLSSISQELESLRQAVAAQAQAWSAPPPAPVTDPNAAPTNAPATEPSMSAAAPVVPPAGISPQRTYESAYSDYTAAHYELAIEGFETFLKFFPKHPDADDAQVNIGNSYYNAGKYQEAVNAYQRVISDYPGTNSVPTAYYKLGLSYMQLKQPDLARNAFETILKNYDASVPEYMLARQSLERVGK